jgi:ACS family glucarate transporter-like MFS transporter
MGVGGAAATAITGALLTWYAWRQVYFVVAFPGILFALWFFWWFRDRPEEHPAVSRAELAAIRGGNGEAPDDAAADVDRGRRRRIAPAALALVCGQQFFRAMVGVFYGTWFPKYLTERYDVSVAESGLLTSLPLLAQVGGSLAGGVIADALLARTGSLRLSRQGVATAGLLACAGSFAAAYFVHSAGAAVGIITAGNLLGTLAGPCAYAVTIDVGGRSTPIVFGAMNMTGNLGAAAFPVVFAAGVTRAGWEPMLLLLAALSIAAAACWLFLDPGPPAARRRHGPSAGSDP